MDVPVHPMGGAARNQYFTSDDGTVKVPLLGHDDDSINKVREAVSSYKWRDEDFLLATYPKNGTHLMWEIMNMLVRGSAEYIKESKAMCMIDLMPVTKIDAAIFPSPRVLNTHYRLDVLPAEFRNKKTVLVLRNPKDSCVSMYYMETKVLAAITKSQGKGIDMSLSTYLNMFLFNKDIPCGSYFDYVEYMWSLRDSPNLLIVYFEDLVLDPMATIEKVNTFMGTKRSPELVEQIADATSFSKMKEGKSDSQGNKSLQEALGADEQKLKKAMQLIYRKGKIGDWKEHFTVADNELFDSYLQKWTAGKDIPFKYI